jgi:uncharacterized repeat protein (TIGR03803 family)
MLRAVSMAFAVVLVLAFVAPQAAQAQTYRVLYTFAGPPADGQNPTGDLIQDAAGNLYGTTTYGGPTGSNGIVFKLDPAGVETILYSFTGGADGGNPAAGLFRDQAGNLYGTTTLHGGTVFKLDTSNVLTVLHSFGGRSDGNQPENPLVSIQGELYGTTVFGGGTGCFNGLGCGMIFKVTKTGTETVLYRFTGGADGAAPQGLVRDLEGNVYGATVNGGGTGCFGTECGVVFKLDTKGKFTVLHTFTGGADGSSSYGRLIRDANNIIRGTTQVGGDLDCYGGKYGPYGCGVVFSLDKTGKETVLHKFWGGPKGYYPVASVLDVTGTLYGTTELGGDLSCEGGNGCGVLFKLGKSRHYTVLYRFTGGADGESPSELTLGRNGSIFGSTNIGGSRINCQVGCGVIFELTP